MTTGTIYTDKLFTGQREMAGLGIYHFNARFYSPKLGRFLSADSIVPNAYNPQDLNRFSYVRNNPLRYTDPTGHQLSVGEGGGGGCYPFCTTPPPPPPTCSSSMCNPNGGNNNNNTNGGNSCSGPNPSVVCLPTPTPTPTPAPYPTSTPTPYTGPYIGPAITSTSTSTFVPPPFVSTLQAANPDGLYDFIPLLPSFSPIDANQLWDVILNGLPVFGLPASSLNQVITTTGTYVVNAAINTSTYIGNVTNNIAFAVSEAVYTGVGGFTPYIFYIPSNNTFLPPTGSN